MRHASRLALQWLYTARFFPDSQELDESIMIHAFLHTSQQESFIDVTLRKLIALENNFDDLIKYMKD